VVPIRLQTLFKPVTRECQFFGKGEVLETTISGNGNQKRAGYELKIQGLKPVSTQGSGWQNCQLSYSVPVGGNVSLSDLNVILKFNTGLTLTSTFAQLGANPIKPGKWNTLVFSNLNFAGQGRQALLKTLIVYQANTGNSVSKVTFGNADVFHYGQGGITNGIIALQPGGCSDLDQNNK